MKSIGAPAALAVLALMTGVFDKPAFAQFDIKSPFGDKKCPDTVNAKAEEEEELEIEFEANGAVQSRADDEDEEVEEEAEEEDSIRQSHEFSIGLGPVDFWEIEAGVELEQPRGDSLDATAVSLENTLKYAIDECSSLSTGIGFFAAYEAAIKEDEPDAVEFGPILGLRIGDPEERPVTIIVNPFLERQIGEEREPGLAFVYGLQTTWQVTNSGINLTKDIGTKGVAVGFEAFGEIPDIGSPPPTSEQEHRIGPVLLFEVGKANEDTPKAEFNLGVLFGLTDATADYAVKWNIGLEF